MKRIILLVLAVVVVILVGFVGLYFLADGFRPRNLGGPVRIVARSRGPALTHGFLGVEFQEQAAPITVERVIRGTGAEQAGMRPGDVIVALDDQATPSMEDAMPIIQASKPNSILRVTIQRDGREQELQVRLIGAAQMVELQERDPGDIDPP